MVIINKYMCAKSPLFSIVTVCFNSEKTIERTLYSVLTQACQDYEYIIIDGLSSDGTLDILKKYEPIFGGKMKWISEKDKGIYDAMNKGILRATGRYVALLNSDDWFEPNALESIASLVCEKPDTIISGNMLYHYETGLVRKIVLNSKKVARRIRFCSIPVNHPATFVPLVVYKKWGVFDLSFKIFADEELLLRYYFGGVRILYINDFLTNMSDGGISSKIKKRMIVERWRILKRYSSSYVQTILLFVLYLCKLLFKLLLPPSFIIIIKKYK